MYFVLWNVQQEEFDIKLTAKKVEIPKSSCIEVQSSPPKSRFNLISLDLYFSRSPLKSCFDFWTSMSCHMFF